MPSTTNWVDLIDPDQATLEASLPAGVTPTTVRHLLEEPRSSRQLRPRLECLDHHVEGVLLVAARAGGALVMQEVHVVVTPRTLVVVCKTPPNGPAFDVSPLHDFADAATATPGMLLFRLFDEIAEDYLDLVEEFDVAIDALEDEVETMAGAEVRDELSELRHDVLHVRRVLAPTRDAARSILDGRLDIEGVELFPHEVELHFADVYDKLLRAVDGLDLSRDLISGVRDYHQAQIAHDQNEVMKRLAAVASILLVPTFIVGLYGQNFVNMPELHWRYGYGFSWALIIGATLFQVWFFRRKKWL